MTVPAGTHAHLILNGDFSAGNLGFSTDYTVVTPNGTVHTNPSDSNRLKDS
ncbi:MAG TPA: hypothetical protein VLK27_13570 [Chthoniobacterales bacterium]|nr:hypothetical protein [Chthoniobacterales bacterium]